MLIFFRTSFSLLAFVFAFPFLIAGRIRAYGLAARRFGSGTIPLADVLKLADEAAQTGQGLLHKGEKSGANTDLSLHAFPVF